MPTTEFKQRPPSILTANGPTALLVSPIAVANRVKGAGSIKASTQVPKEQQNWMRQQWIANLKKNTEKKRIQQGNLKTNIEGCVNLNAKGVIARENSTAGGTNPIPFQYSHQTNKKGTQQRIKANSKTKPSCVKKAVLPTDGYQKEDAVLNGSHPFDENSFDMGNNPAHAENASHSHGVSVGARNKWVKRLLKKRHNHTMKFQAPFKSRSPRRKLNSGSAFEDFEFFDLETSSVDSTCSRIGGFGASGELGPSNDLLCELSGNNSMHSGNGWEQFYSNPATSNPDWDLWQNPSSLGAYSSDPEVCTDYQSVMHGTMQSELGNQNSHSTPCNSSFDTFFSLPCSPVAAKYKPKNPIISELSQPKLVRTDSLEQEGLSAYLEQTKLNNKTTQQDPTNENEGENNGHSKEHEARRNNVQTRTNFPKNGSSERRRFSKNQQRKSSSEAGTNSNNQMDPELHSLEDYKLTDIDKELDEFYFDNLEDLGNELEMDILMK